MRFTGGNCIAAFRPDVVPIPLPDAHFAYHWDGSTVDYVQTLNKGEDMSVSYWVWDVSAHLVS